MRTTQFIRQALDASAHNFLTLINDMRDAPLTFPTDAGGNHPLWILGHIAVAESKLIQDIALGCGHPLDRWMSIFGPFTTPVADASAYPSFDEVMAAFQRARAFTLETLDALSESDLDRPSAACPPEFKEFVGTVGNCFLHTITHMATHTGQVADARRAAGREPLLFRPPTPAPQQSLASVA
jgi:uncharacterized damage-inducible protein DinB